jgi:thymidylate synthase
MTITKLKTTIKLIVKKATELKDKHTDEINAPVNYACIFSQNKGEFNELTTLTKKLGTRIKETSTGPIFKLTNEISTVSGRLKLLKIRKPDKIKTNYGYADFTLSNYSEFKKKYLPSKKRAKPVFCLSFCCVYTIPNKLLHLHLFFKSLLQSPLKKMF